MVGPGSARWGPRCTMQRTPKESDPMTVAAAHQAAPDLPRRPLGRVAGRPRRRQPGRSRDARRHDLQRDRGAVRGGRRGRRRGVRGDPRPAGLRARPRSCATSARGIARAARGARPADRARGRQADPRRAGRGRPCGPDLPARRGGGGADDRRGDPARPHAVVARTGSGSPGASRSARSRPSARSTSRSTWRPTSCRPAIAVGQPDRPQAAVQGPADDADGGRDHRGGRCAGGLGQRSCR